MALQNEILVGRFNRALQKLLGIKGGPPAPQLSPEFSPRIGVPTGQEDAYLWGYDLFAGVAVKAAVALQFSEIRMRNPVGSKVAIELVRMNVINGVTADPGLQVRFAAQGFNLDDATLLPGLPVQLDARSSRLASSAIFSTGLVGFGTAILNFVLPSGGEVDLVGPPEKGFLPLLPGTGIQVIGSVVNNALTLSFMWRERPMEESELQ